MKQKFSKGDLVRVAKDLGQSMSHFQSDCDAIVMESYADQYPSIDKTATKQYTLYMEGRGTSSWYEEWQLTLIEPSRTDLLEQWQEEEKKEHDQQSDLGWIFSNSVSLGKALPSTSIEALAKCFGLINMWGNRGEGVTYMTNLIGTYNLAAPFLSSGDKEGWVKRAEEIRKDMFSE